jgi:phosphoenolpyruvate carboxylase
LIFVKIAKHDEVFKDVYDFYINWSNVFPANYYDLPRKQKFDVLSKVKGINPADFTNEITRSTIESIQAIKVIQENNGELGANRYIISNNESALNVMETFAMLRLS